MPLLGDADHSNRGRDAQACICCKRPSLIEHHIGHDVVLLEPGNRMLRGRRIDLLAVRREEPHIAWRHIALTDQIFHRFEERTVDALRIERSPAPDFAVRDLCRKGIMRPGLPFCGHDILMRHNDDRVEGSIASWPAEEDAEIIDAMKLRCRKRLRIEPLERRDPASECLIVARRDIVSRDRRNPEELLEALDRLHPGLIAIRSDRSTLGLGRLEKCRLHRRQRCHACRCCSGRHQSRPLQISHDMSSSRRPEGLLGRSLPEMRLDMSTIAHIVSVLTSQTCQRQMLPATGCPEYGESYRSQPAALRPWGYGHRARPCCTCHRRPYRSSRCR